LNEAADYEAECYGESFLRLPPKNYIFYDFFKIIDQKNYIYDKIDILPPPQMGSILKYIV